MFLYQNLSLKGFSVHFLKKISKIQPLVIQLVYSLSTLYNTQDNNSTTNQLQTETFGDQACGNFSVITGQVFSGPK